MRHSSSLVNSAVIGVLITAAQLAIAAPAPEVVTPPPPGAEDAEPQKVIIRAERLNETDQRRMSTASKLIFGREELDRNGDSSVSEILKRLPGVTTGGRPGRGGEVRMRGLGSGTRKSCSMANDHRQVFHLMRCRRIKLNELK